MMTDAKIRENLKRFRMIKNSTSPYQVFPDAVLDQLIAYRPKTIKDLTSIKGFPPNGKRVEKYGEDIIEFFKNGCKVVELEKF